MLRPWLKILRPPNLITSAADVIAGFFIARVLAGGGAAAVWVAPLIASSVLIYSLGLVLNDIADVKRDRAAGKKRPIAEGDIGIRAAWFFSFILAAGALAAAGFARGLGGIPLRAVGSIIVLVICYNFGTKRIPVFNGLNMGLCRGVNVVLGASVFLSFGGLWEFPLARFAVVPLIALGYVFFVTLVSDLEDRLKRSPARGPLLLLLGIAVTAIMAAAAFAGGFEPVAIAIAGIGSLIILLKVVRAVRDSTPANVGALVKWSLLMIPVLNGVMLASFGEIYIGIAVALLAVPAAAIGRIFYVT